LLCCKCRRRDGEIPVLAVTVSLDAPGFICAAREDGRAPSSWKVCVNISASAPSAEHFRTVLDAIRTNQHRQPISGVAGLHKISKMRWCLAEVACELDRRFLMTAASVTLFQDGRKSALSLRLLSLLVRFNGSNTRLDTRRGIQWALRPSLVMLLRFVKRHSETRSCVAFVPRSPCAEHLIRRRRARSSRASTKSGAGSAIVESHRS
jgi:hypothetical protein